MPLARHRTFGNTKKYNLLKNSLRFDKVSREIEFCTE